MDRHLEKLAEDEYRSIGKDYANALHKSGGVKAMLTGLKSLTKTVGGQARQVAGVGRTKAREIASYGKAPGQGRVSAGLFKAKQTGKAVIKEIGKTPEFRKALIAGGALGAAGAGGYAVGRG